MWASLGDWASAGRRAAAIANASDSKSKPQARNRIARLNPLYEMDVDRSALVFIRQGQSLAGVRSPRCIVWQPSGILVFYG